MLTISNVGGIATVVIEPIRVNFNDINTSTMLGAKVAYDLLGIVSIKWMLLANTSSGVSETASGDYTLAVDPNTVTPGTVGELVFRYLESKLPNCKIV